MRLKGLIIAAGIAVVLLGVCSIEFNNKSNIVVKAPLYDVARQVNDLNNWKKWDTIFKASSSIKGAFSSDQTATTINATYTLHHLSPVALSLIKSNNGNSKTTLVTIAPLTDTATVIITEEKTNIFGYLAQNKASKDGAAIMDNFKAWMEDAASKYGYPIQLVPVKDTLILTAKAPVTDTSVNNTTGNLYKLLYNFIRQHQLPFEKNYFYKTVLNDKEIAVGIPVYKPVKDTGNIHCLQLPHAGRLIEGQYNGNAANIQTIYTAVNIFMMEKHLKQVAQPLEQYNVADTAMPKNSNVKVKVYYPIF